MTKFSEIPSDLFPLNKAAYNRLRDEIGSISARFSDLGTRDGAAVAKKMEEVYQALDNVWETIRIIENREEREAEIQRIF